MGKLDEKVAIITGASQGIGRASALLFAKEGAKVVVADITVSGGEETVSMIKETGGEACFIKTDVSIEDDVKKMIKAAMDNYGKLDILFNNAGIVEKIVPTHETQVSEWDRTINVNLRGVFLGMRFAIPEMLKIGGGAIINTASGAGLVGLAGSASYCASKGGVVQLTKAAALDYATQNIRVNCICPGTIWTPIIERFTGGSEEALQQNVKYFSPMDRFGKPEEIAQAALFLACDDSSYITGIPMPVDGGYTAR